MKKIFGSIVAVLLLVSAAWATPIPPGECMRVDLDPNDPSVVLITGGAEDVARQNFLVQYLPDDFRDQGLNKIVVPAEQVSSTQRRFQMSRDGLKLGLIGFNFAKTTSWTLENIWLGLPSEYVLMGAGLKMTMSERDENIPLSGGAHFLNLSGMWSNFVPLKGFIEGNGTACGAASKKPCIIFLEGNQARTEVLKDIISSYWNVQVQTRPGTGHNVTVTGPVASRSVPISDPLLGELQKLVGNPNAGQSLNSLCPEQAKLLREAVRCE